MKKTLFLTAVIIVFGLNTLTAGTPHSDAYDKETKTFKLKAGGELLVESDDGYIRINTWDKDEVEVIMHKRAWGKNRREAERRLNDIDVEIIERGSSLIIRDITDQERERNVGLLDLIRGDWEHGTSVDFELTVPKRLDLDLSSDDGDISIDNVEGDISVEIDDGDINIDNVRSNRIELDIDDGEIELDNVKRTDGNSKGLLIISGDDSEVILRRTEMETIEVDGDDSEVTFYDVVTKNLDVDLDDGEFDGDLKFIDSGRVRILIDGGDVSLALEKNISAYFNLYANDGRIRSDFSFDIEHEDGKTWVKERVGGGETNIRVEVDDGYISVKYR